ncbi:MAG: hypothetical protein ABSE73_04000 [Planctomycetota bacterium]
MTKLRTASRLRPGHHFAAPPSAASGGGTSRRSQSFVTASRASGTGPSGRYEHNDNVAKINLHRIIFRAKSPTQVIAFNDENDAPGEELIINFVQLKRYLERVLSR